MPTLTITTTYADGSTLTAAMLDAIKTQIQTFVNTTKLDADNLQDSAITTAKLAAASVTTAKIATGAISIDTQIAANTITNSHLTDDCVTATEIADGAIDAAAKIASNVVTYAKLDVCNLQVQSSASTASRTASSFAAITNATVNITASGTNKFRQIFFGNVSSGAAGGIYTEAGGDPTFQYAGHYKLTRDTVPSTVETDLATHIIGCGANSITEVGGLTFYDFTSLTSGAAYQYKLYYKLISTGALGSTGVTNCKLVVQEI